LNGTSITSAYIFDAFLKAFVRKRAWIFQESLLSFSGFSPDFVTAQVQQHMRGLGNRWKTVLRTVARAVQNLPQSCRQVKTHFQVAEPLLF